MDEEIRSTLYDISTRGDFLKTTTTLVTEDGVATVALPVYLKHIEELAVDGGNLLELISFDQYQQYIEGENTLPSGEPEVYARGVGYLYLDPCPDAIYTLNITYSHFHANSVTAIEFGEVFREAIYAGVLKRLWLGQLASHPATPTEGPKHAALYENEIGLRLPDVYQQPCTVRYRDII